MLIIIATDGRRQGVRPVVVQVVVANNIARPCSGHIDAISIREQLHRMRNLVVFKEIVPGMIVLLASLPALVSTAPPVPILGRNLMPANRSAALAIQTPIRFHTSGDEHRRIAAMVQLVVDHSVVATLPGPEARGMPGNLTEVMNIVVDDVVVVVDVFRAGSITRQKNSSLAQMRKFELMMRFRCACRSKRTPEPPELTNRQSVTRQSSAPRKRSNAVGRSNISQSCCIPQPTRSSSLVQAQRSAWERSARRRQCLERAYPLGPS